MRALVVIGLLAAVLAAPALAHAAPAIARPNPALVSIRPDYVNPLTAPDGSVATLPPLDPAATAAAVVDQRYLTYRLRDDLGGFVPAPVGADALTSGGRAVIGTTAIRPQLPLFAQAAGGNVSSFTLTGGASNPPENGNQPVPGIGVPPASPPPTSGTTVPPPNQGFGGKPAPQPPTTTTTPGGGGGGTTAPPPRPPTTTTPTTTTTTPTTPPPPPPTTATTTTTTTGGGGGGGGGSPGDCGSAGLSIDSDHATCSLSLLNAAPGDSVSEVMTVTNTSGAPFTLSLRAAGTQNQLWQDLRMGVWEQGSAPPVPLPPLLFWTTQANQLGPLAAGQSTHYVIELLLPTTAGNGDQGLAASIDFVWRATG